MTWEEAKDQIAVSYCYSRWSDIDWYVLNQIHEVTQPPYMEERCIKQAAELYAREVADKAYDAGHNRGMYVFEPDGFDLDPPSKEEFMKQLDI